MDLRPWNYWTRDGLPQEGTDEAIAALERVYRGEPEASWRPALLDSPVGADEDIPSAPSRKPTACCR